MGLEAQARQLSSTYPQLLIAASRVAQSLMPGLHGRKRAGFGGDFWQFRPFSQGDNASRIDWRKSARSDEIFLREREWSAPNRLMFWVDQGPSMNWKSNLAEVNKRDRANLLAMSLAILSATAGEFTGLLDDEAKPRHSNHHLSHMAHRLETHQGHALKNIKPPQGHACCILFSDFLEPFGEISQQLKNLSQTNHQIHLIEIADPAEESLPWQGHVQFQSLHQDARIEFSAVEDIRTAYSEARTQHRAKLADLARNLGLHHRLHRTDEAPNKILLSLYHELSQRPGA